MKRVGYILFIAAFFVLCLIPSAGLLLRGPAPAAANESPAAVPRLMGPGRLNMAFLADLRDYVDKGFFLRLESITGWDALCAGVFRTSANEDVLLGPDGWLFYGAAAGQISGTERMNDRELWCAARSLYLMQEYTAEQGGRFIFTVPCGRYTLYPEHAPDYIKVTDESDRESLAELLAEMGVTYADLYPAFSAEDDSLCWRWDSHWNGKGAALAADVLLEAAGKQSDYFHGAFVETDMHTGDLYAMLYPAGHAAEPQYMPAAGWRFAYTSDFHSYDDMTITTACLDGEGSLLLFRDSSGRDLYPYLAEAYENAWISRMNSYRLDKIGETGADTVIVELAERTLNYLLKYPAVYPSPAREALMPGMESAPCDITADAPDAVLPGCVKITGTLLTETAADSPVYIRAGDALYEAIPGEAGFTAWLPFDAAEKELSVFVLGK